MIGVPRGMLPVMALNGVEILLDAPSNYPRGNVGSTRVTSLISRDVAGAACCWADAAGWVCCRADTSGRDTDGGAPDESDAVWVPDGVDRDAGSLLLIRAAAI